MVVDIPELSSIGEEVAKSSIAALKQDPRSGVRLHLATVHAVPDLRMAGGRLGDDFSHDISITSKSIWVIA